MIWDGKEWMRVLVLFLFLFRFIQACKKVEYDGPLQFWYTMVELFFWFVLLGALGLWTNN